MSRKRAPYSPEFRWQMVELVRSGRTPVELAREFEPVASTIRSWVIQADRDEGRRADGLTRVEKGEWTKWHPLVRLVHWEKFDSLQAAVNREKELKTGFGRKWLKREYAAGRTRQAGEPASILLKRIRAERKKAEQERKTQKKTRRRRKWATSPPAP